MSSELQLRHATVTDLDAILALERVTANAPHWPKAAYAAIVEAVAEPHRCLFVAERSAAIAGFAVGLVAPSATVAELETVAVAASARRTGIGRALCTTVLDWCRECGATSVVLEVRADSDAAIALYTQLGFAITGRRPHYYRDPEADALILSRRLH